MLVKVRETMVGEPLLKIMFGPEKGLLGVENKKREKEREIERLP